MGAGQNGRIAFHSNWNPPDNTNPEGDYEIFTMEPDGSDIHQLTDNGASDGHPNFSPDGKKITFVSDRDGGNPEIYVMNADGSNQTRITDNFVVDTDPGFSPDGEQIVFQGDEYGNGGEILVMNADGSGTPTNLSENASYDTDPAVSPDGKVAFATLRDANFDDNFEIYTMNADGSNQTNISNNPAWDSFPNVSPDGQKIAFHSTRDGDFEIYVMNADGSNQTRLTNLGASTGAPDWQPLPLDTTPPAVSETYPSNLATGVAATDNITATFIEEGSGINESTLRSGFKVEQVKPTGNVPVSPTAVTYDVDSQTATFDPSKDLPKGLYRVTLTGVEDNAGNVMSDYTWTFTTAGPPKR